jgi:hypothetical protein
MVGSAHLTITAKVIFVILSAAKDLDSSVASLPQNDSISCFFSVLIMEIVSGKFFLTSANLGQGKCSRRL